MRKDSNREDQTFCIEGCLQYRWFWKKIVENFWKKLIKFPQDIFKLDYKKIETLDGWANNQ